MNTARLIQCLTTKEGQPGTWRKIKVKKKKTKIKTSLISSTFPLESSHKPA